MRKAIITHSVCAIFKYKILIFLWQVCSHSRQPAVALICTLRTELRFWAKNFLRHNCSVETANLLKCPWDRMMSWTPTVYGLLMEEAVTSSSLQLKSWGFWAQILLSEENSDRYIHIRNHSLGLPKFWRCVEIISIHSLGLPKFWRRVEIILSCPFTIFLFAPTLSSWA